MTSTTENTRYLDAGLLRYDRLVFAIPMLHLPIVMFLVPIGFDGVDRRSRLAIEQQAGRQRR